ncbi:hypothetical protein [Streptomyces sp. NPDC048496]|uniref:hypothetical protein n=1 Tax=Streptomyces sp. NPDC048496 TaxID=3365558 RepID=UPI00371D0046
MGDGILEALKAVGLRDTAPRAILAHEFGHHVQYEDNLFANTTLTGPEATRRTELMADAFGTYFLTHSRGEALNTKRVLGSAQSFYEVGDCGFTNPGHHGTPNQRLAASSWGGARGRCRRLCRPAAGRCTRTGGHRPENAYPDPAPSRTGRLESRAR